MTTPATALRLRFAAIAAEAKLAGMPVAMIADQLIALGLLLAIEAVGKTNATQLFTDLAAYIASQPRPPDAPAAH